MENDKVVGVADIMHYLQISLYKLVKHVHVDVDQQLARKVAKRQSDTWLAIRVKTPDHFRKEPKNVRVVDMPLDDVEENFVIDVGEKFPDVAL